MANAVTLNGSSQYLKVDNFSGINALTNFTVEFWVRNTTTSVSYAPIFFINDATTSFARFTTEYGVGSQGFNFGVRYGTTNSDGYEAGAILTHSTWVHVAYVHNATTKVTDIYINGVAHTGYELRNTGVGTIQSSNGMSIYLGFNLLSNPDRYFNGAFGGFFRVWNRLLSLGEISYRYDKQITASDIDDPTLLVNVNFAEGSGNISYNDATVGEDLDFVGTPTWITGPTLSSIKAEQHSFRFRDDNGSETTASWLASLNTDVTRAKDTNTRLRTLVNVTGDLPAQNFQLEYKDSAGTTWTKLPVDPSVITTIVDESLDNNNGTGTLAGNATNQVGYVRMTTATNSQDGSIYWTGTLTNPFTVEFDFWSGGGNGADGVCFFYGTTSTLGNEETADDGYRIYFSEYHDIIGLRFDGGSILASITEQNLDNSTWRTVKIIIDGTNITVYLNDVEKLNYTDINRTFGGTYYGIGARTGGLNNEHRVRNVLITSGNALNTYPFIVTASTNVATSGETTTAQLTAPSGKTTSDFVAGRLSDDENPADSVNITADGYTEMEWSIKATSYATNGTTYDFRVTMGGTPLDVYTEYPQWTIPSSVAETSLPAPIYPIWKTGVNSLSDFTSMVTAAGQSVVVENNGWLGKCLAVIQDNININETGVRIEQGHLSNPQAKIFETWFKIKPGSTFTGFTNLFFTWGDSAQSGYGSNLIGVAVTPSSVASGYQGFLRIQEELDYSSQTSSTPIDVGAWTKVTLQVRDTDAVVYVNREHTAHVLVSHASISSRSIGTVHVGKFYSNGLNGTMLYDNMSLRPAPTGAASTVGGMMSDVYNGWLQRYLGYEGGIVRPFTEGNNDAPNYAPAADIVSEGQAYGMLFAVQHNDKDTFDLIENFNRNVLERANYPSSTASLRAQGAHLMGWHYNAQNSNASGPNSMYDWNFASDADIDRAKALLYAHNRWGNSSGASIPYLARAKEILDDLKIWSHNSVNGVRYMGANSLSLNDTTAETNVSYFDMTTFRLARQMFSDQFWDQSINGMYEIIRKATSSTGSLATNWGLPPDWVNWNTTNLTAELPDSGRSTRYSYDAFRTVYRMFIDYDFYQEKQARDLLAGQLYISFASEWNRSGMIKAEYNHDGTVHGDYEGSMFYSVNMFPFFVAGATVAGASIYYTKVTPAYRNHPAGSYWSDSPSSSGGEPRYFNGSWIQFAVGAKERLYPHWGMWRDTASQLW